MKRTMMLQGVRRMKFESVLDRWERRQLSQAEAAEVLGMSERSFRRWRDRYEDAGLEGLYDRRLGKASAIRMLTVIDEFTRECLAIVVDRKLRHDDVLACLTDLFTRHGPPDHIRSDNGSEFTAAAVREWLSRVGVKTLYAGSRPWHRRPATI